VNAKKLKVLLGVLVIAFCAQYKYSKDARIWTKQLASKLIYKGTTLGITGALITLALKKKFDNMNPQNKK
jgi:hypothetical protein